jgi:PAS domain S-box-containing protein
MESTNRDMLAVHDELSDQNDALSQSETRFRLMVDEVKDYAIFLLNPEGNVSTWNTGAERILGYVEGEIVGCAGDIIFLPEHQEHGKSAAEMKKAREHGRSEDEHWHLRRDGSRFWGNSVLTALWSDEVLIGYVKILQDTTARKRSQDALEAAYQRERHITDILQSPLTKTPPEDTVPGLLTVTFYESALDEAEVGGDFFDAFSLPNGMAALVIGDASGKGLEAALRAMQVKELLRAFLHVRYHSATEVVTQINEYLCAAHQPSDEDRFGFVTLCLVILNPETGQGETISAGCEPALIVSAEGNPKPLLSPGLPFGVDAQAQYEVVPFHLSRQDTLVLVTDGITEARCGKEFLTYEGMAALSLQAASAPSLKEMGREIMEGARVFAEGHFRDDVCLLLARRR